MWWRLIGVLGLTFAALALIDVFHLGALLGARPGGDDADEGPLSAGRQLFWTLLFVAVFLTSLLAAARRGKERLRLAVAAIGRRPPS